MYVRIASIFTLILAFATLSFAQGWAWQNPSPQGNTIRDAAQTENAIWAVTDGGMLLRSENGGLDWRTTVLSSTNDLLGVAFSGTEFGIVVGSDGLIMRTVDGGINWTEQTSGTSRQLNDISLVDEFNAWVCGDSGLVLHTADGGETWNPQESEVTQNLWSVCFVDLNHGWATGWSNPHSPILRTNDGGETWFSDIGYGWPVFSIHFADTANGWICGSGGCVYHSGDGGSTWRQQNANAQWSDLTSIFFADSLNGWVVGSVVRHTTDGGETWASQTISETTELYKILFTASGLGLTFGLHGTILRSENGGDEWICQTTGRSRQFNQIAFADDHNGWAVGSDYPDSSRIFRTTDGGLNWEPSATDLYENEYQFMDISAVSPSTAYAIAYNAHFLSTLDGGLTWQTHDYHPNKAFFGVHFRDELQGWIAGGGNSGFVALTQDGGNTWIERPSVSEERMHAVQFIDSMAGWCVGWNGGIIYSANAGWTWILQSSGTTHHLNDLDFIDRNRGWVVGDSGTILRTQNGGQTWNRMNSGVNVALNSVDFVDEEHGWVVGGDYVYGPAKILYSSNGGSTWVPQVSHMAEPLSGVAFVSATSGWAVGRGGAILHCTGADPVEADTIEAQQDRMVSSPASFALSVYPNPFNPSTTLEFQLPQASKTTVRIYDLTGRCVETLADGFYPQGQHRLAFDGSGLASGLYFARIEGTEPATTRKLLLVK